MAVYISVNDSESNQVASNTGWSHVIDWVEKFDHKEYPESWHLIEHGWCQNCEDLISEIKSMQKEKPPQTDLKKTLRGLTTFASGANVVVINNGITNVQEDGSDDSGQKDKTDKKFSIEPSSSDNGGNRGRKMKRRIKAMEEEQDVVVDPIQEGQEDEGPVVPLGAQYLMGLHDYTMKAAEFLMENAGSMEPETAGKFVDVEKSLMNTVKVIASTFNERYPDLPPLDGADYEDPMENNPDEEMDVDGEIDEQMDESTEGDEIDKSSDEMELEADSEEGEDDELEEEDSELEEKAIDDEDEFEEDEEDDEYEKAARKALGMRAKAMLHRHQERKRIEAEAKTKVPDSAADVVKSAAGLLREISRNAGFGPLVRQRSKHQYQQLLKCLSSDNVSTKSVILNGGLDFDEIAKKLGFIESKFLTVKAESDSLGNRIEGVK